MQITSTVSQHKMEPLNGNPNNSASSEPITHEDAEQVGGAFCHQFYITVSENRGAITRFYGHESIFQLDDKVVTGSGEIAKQYDLLPESTHFKIHSIRGLPTFHKQGVLVHVIGTVNLRPFVQTFVLGQQGQKKYYIEIDNFQYIDSFFENKPDADKPAATIAVNGHSNGVNGKVTKPAAKAPEPTPEPVKQQTPQKPQQTPKKAEEPRPAKQETPKSAEKANKAPKQHQQQQHQPQQQHQQAPAPAPIPEPAQVPVQIHEAPKPKTWANLVRGGNQQPPQPNFNQVHQQQLHQHQMQAAAILHQQAAQQQAAQQHAIYQQAQRVREQHAAIIQHQAQLHQPAADPQQQQQGGEDAASLLERKIYLGGITREIVPSNTAQAETEIKQVFYKYGEVEEVRMPRKVLDSPNDTSKHAFAFITMRTKQGVQAIFNGATRDEAGVWKLPLKLDAFGFDGLAQISEQRDQPPGGAFRGGRGGGGGGGGGFGNRGGYFRRGGATGGAPRGMQRGGFQNNSMNNGH